VDWKECIRNNFGKKVKIDKNLIKSLIAGSSRKLYVQALLPLNDKTASSKISLVYDSLRELLEALALLNGCKIYNHECYRAFLKEVLKESYSGDKFDNFRKIRNAINYYGKDVSADEAGPILAEMVEFIKSIKAKYFKDKWSLENDVA